MGLKHCFYSNCDSNSKKNPNIEFVPFVKPFSDFSRCKRWIELCGKPHFNPENITSQHVCTKHFPSDVVNDWNFGRLDWKKNPDLEPFPAHSKDINTSGKFELNPLLENVNK